VPDHRRPAGPPSPVPAGVGAKLPEGAGSPAAGGSPELRRAQGRSAEPASPDAPLRGRRSWSVAARLHPAAGALRAHRSRRLAASPVPSRDAPRVRRRRGAVAVGLTAVAVLTAAPGAEARGGALPGQLHAVSTGTATILLQGRLVVFGLLPEPSRLEVRGPRRSYTVRLDGVLLRPDRRGVVRVHGASGRFYVRGASVRVSLAGGGIVVSVIGRGRALLAGQGLVSLNGAQPVAWPSPPRPLAVAADRPPDQGHVPGTAGRTRSRARR
jgi:hypothetical protein